MSVIYIKEQGSYVKMQGDLVVVTKGTQKLLEYSIHIIENVVVFGNVQITTQALKRFLENGIDINYFTYSGKYKIGICPQYR